MNLLIRQFKIIFFCLIFVPFFIQAQPIVTTAGDASGCAGIILVPVTVSDVYNIGAISLALEYNTSILTFLGYEEKHSQLSTGQLVVNANNGKVYISWASEFPANIANGTLIKLKFSIVTGSSELAWDTQTQGNCEYSDPLGVVIPSDYTNGSITAYQIPAITVHPTDNSVYVGENTSFSIGASGYNLTFQWQISINNGSSWDNLSNNTTYSNVNGSSLYLTDVSLGMSGYKYRCVVGGGCPPPVMTNAAALLVTDVPPNIEAQNLSAACAGNILQPITFTNMNGIGSISLVLQYDTILFRYMGYQDVNSQIGFDNLIVNNSGGKVYMAWGSSTSLNLGNDILVKLIFDCSGGTSTNSWDIETPGNCEITDINGNVFATTYVNGSISVIPSCDFNDINESYWAYDEIQYLCGRGIVSGSNCNVYPDSLLKRQQLAKIAFLGVFGGNIPVVSDAFPSPFNDLQNTSTYYYRFAKALSYLEYDDGISPFDRNRFNFDPEGNIERILVLKVLLETFDIPPFENEESYFDDVPIGMPFYGYVNSALLLGIIDASNSEFRPHVMCTRAEAFVMLERIINSNPFITFTDISNTLDPVTSSFFIPGNYTPYNFSTVLGMGQGNFNNYTKSSFAISGRGVPLNFEHSYNSFLTELPNEFFRMNPLGRGWSHSYNAYIINTDEIRDANNKVIGKPCLIVFWPDGTMNVYDNIGNPTNPSPITKGVYDVLTKISDTEFTVTTKNQITYTFKKIDDSADTAPYVITSIKDRNNNTSIIQYEIDIVSSFPRISSVTDATDRNLIFNYLIGTNFISSVSDPLGRTINFGHTMGQLSSFSDAKGQTTKYYYGSSAKETNLLDSIRLPKGNIITNQYHNRKLISTSINNQNPTTIAHNPNYVLGNNDYYKSTVTVPQQSGENITADYDYNKNGSVTKASGNDALDISSQYNNSTQPLLPSKIINNKNGVSITPTYDTKGNIIQQTVRHSGIEISEYYQFNALNDVTQYTDANNHAVFYTYTNGNLTKIKDALNNETNIIYNEHGQPVSITNPLDVTVIYEYNEYGNQNGITLPSLGISSSMDFDIASRMISATNFNNKTTTYSYDNNDNLITEIDPLNNTTSHTYDKNDNLASIVNAKGNATTFTYDFTTDLLLSEVFQDATKNFTYNFDGSLKSFTNSNGSVLNVTYDNSGRVLDDGYASYAYLANGNLSTVTKDGKAITYGYDVLNRIISVNYDGNTIAYTYDKVGNLINLIYPGNKTVTYAYDETDKLKTVKDWNNKTTTYNYRNDGQLDYLLYPNNVKTAYIYDNAGRLTGSSAKRSGGSGTAIAEYTYLLDSLGNHIQETILEPYTSYPAFTESTLSYVYNNANRIQSAGTVAFTFDYNGNTTGKTGYSYTYDVLNNLTAVTGSMTASYVYDGAGNRREATRNAVTTKYVLNVLGMSNVLMETNAAGTPQNYYVYGLGLISRINSGNSTEYYIYDYRGSTVAIVDATSSANVTHKYQYDDFGYMLQMEESDYNPYRYVGKYGVIYENDELQFMRARYYDPTIGRFLSEDPIWSTNLYPYADNNSTNNIDPNGLITQSAIQSKSDEELDKLLKNLKLHQKKQTSKKFKQYLKWTQDEFDTRIRRREGERELREMEKKDAERINNLRKKVTKTTELPPTTYYESTAKTTSIPGANTNDSPSGFGRGNPGPFFMVGLDGTQIEITKDPAKNWFFGWLFR